MQTPKRPFRYPLTALLLFTCLAAIGCGEDDPGYEHTYTVRGVVASLPSDNAIDEFSVHHEAIPDYQSINGSVGMHEMVMPFPVPDRSVLEGIAVGDKVELTFGERFEPNHRMGVISVVKLPAETVLDISETERR